MSRPRRRKTDNGIEALLRQRGGSAWLPNDEEVPEEELANALAGGWDVEHARAFLAHDRWLAAVQDHAQAQRVPFHVMEERLGLAPLLVEGVDYVRTRAELDADHG